MAVQVKSMAIVTWALLSAVMFSSPAFSADVATGGYNTEMHKMGMMKMIDANGDHIVTIEEFTTFYNNAFDELDTNHDGLLDAKEWVGTGGSTVVMVGTGGYNRELRKMTMMKAMDANGDHKVSKEEFITFQTNSFNAMDKKGDKQLDPQEWLAKQTGN